LIIRSRAPVRLGLAGGGTDVSPYTEEHGGAVLNATINKYASGSLEFREDGKVHLHSFDYDKTISLDHIKDLGNDGDLALFKTVINRLYKGRNGLNLYLHTEVPPRSGLGGSAAAFIAIVALFNHLQTAKKLTPYELAELAYELERKDLGIPGGRQDQYATVFGGLNFMEFKGNEFVRVSPLKIKKDVLLELEKNLILVRAPERKHTDDILADQKKNVETGKTIEHMHRTKELAIEMKNVLLLGDLHSFGEILHQAWEEKKKFSTMISNPEIDRIYALAREHGAIGGKITGAGGGGHMLFYCSPNKEMYVRNALQRIGCMPVDFSFNMEGLETWEA